MNSNQTFHYQNSILDTEGCLWNSTDPVFSSEPKKSSNSKYTFLSCTNSGANTDPYQTQFQEPGDIFKLQMQLYGFCKESQMAEASEQDETTFDTTMIIESQLMNQPHLCEMLPEELPLGAPDLTADFIPDDVTADFGQIGQDEPLQTESEIIEHANGLAQVFSNLRVNENQEEQKEQPRKLQ